MWVGGWAGGSESGIIRVCIAELLDVYKYIIYIVVKVRGVRFCHETVLSFAARRGAPHIGVS